LQRQETGSLSGVKMDGNIDLLDCTVTPEEFSFSIRTYYGKVYQIKVPTVRLLVLSISSYSLSLCPVDLMHRHLYL
jgi:hypothetical protein